MPSQKITTFLWFDHDAEEAVRFYVSLFARSRIVHTTRLPPEAPAAAGNVLTIAFELEGQDFVALNGGPRYQFTEAISLLVRCRSQQEIDTLWAKLSEGGCEQACGWLKDKYGLSWQIVPEQLFEWMQDPDPARARRVQQAMMGMVKFDVEALRQARDRADARMRRRENAPARGESSRATFRRGEISEHPMATTRRAARPAPASSRSGDSQRDPAVTALIAALDHPLRKELETVRRIILKVSPQIREGVKWKSPSFRTADYFATLNLRARAGQQRVWLILHTGAKARPASKRDLSIDDPAGLLTWLAKDRCLVTFAGAADLRRRRAALDAIIRQWIRQV